MPNHSLLRSLIAASAALCLPLATSALTLDNFEEGDFSIFDSSSPFPGFSTRGEQAGLNPNNVVGGVRLVDVTAQLASTLPVTTATATLQTTPLDDGVVHTADGVGRFEYFYDGIAGGNIDSGSAGALNLDLSAFSSVVVRMAGVVGTPGMRLLMWDSSGRTGLGGQPLFEGDNFVSLIGTGLDLTDIQQIQLVINTTASNTGVLTFFGAVPEPGTGLLLAAGLIGLGARRPGGGARGRLGT